MPWQTTFTLSSPGKGCHLVTNEVQRHIAEGLKGTKVGILHLFIQHTSAGLSISEQPAPHAFLASSPLITLAPPPSQTRTSIATSART